MASDGKVYSAVVGVDVGGTNTDAVLLVNSDGKPEILSSVKESTTGDVMHGVQRAIATTLKKACVAGHRFRVTQVNIGTTHFVNALVQRRGLVKVAVIRLCGTSSIKVPPFSDFPAELQTLIQTKDFLVEGGFQFDGTEISSVDESEIIRCVNEIRDLGVKNIAVVGIFSVVRKEQEENVRDIILSNFPESSVTLSHHIGYLGLLERENASILNESLKPLCKETVQGFRKALDELGLDCPFFLTQNDGTVISEKQAVQFPVYTFASGPTNSMRGAAFLSGITDAIVVDIGGTTTDVGILRNGFPREASTEVRIAGIRTNFRMPDVFSFGLGGGSYVSEKRDGQGNLHDVSVGPLSAGYNLPNECFVFAEGDISSRVLTATDIAVSSNLAKIGNPDNVKSLDRMLVDKAVYKMRKMLERAIEQVKLSDQLLPVIMVGGGSILIDVTNPVKGTSKTIMPLHFGVANAVGAALSQVSGSVDHVVSLMDKIDVEQMNRDVENAMSALTESASENEKRRTEEDARKKHLEQARQIAVGDVCEGAKQAAVKAGADPMTTEIVDKTEMPLTYLPGCATRLKAKAVGQLVTNEDIADLVIYELKEAPIYENIVSSVDKQTKTATGKSILADEDGDDHGSSKIEVEPNIDSQNGEWILSEWDVQCISVGAGIQGCGGGGNPYLGKLLTLKAIKEGKKIRIVTPQRLMTNADPENDLVVEVAFMGAPLMFIEKLVSGNETIRALQCMQELYSIGKFEGNDIKNKEGIEIKKEKNITFIDDYQPKSSKEHDVETSVGGRKIVALISAEIGGLNCIEPLLVSAELGLPVLDCDGMGRAFPELQMFCPFMYGMPAYPATLADDKNRRAVVLEVDTAKHLEDHFRNVVIGMGCIGGLVLPALKKEDVMQNTVMHSMSHAWRIGRAVLRARRDKVSPIDAICQQENGKVLIVGKIMDVRRETTGGFNKGFVQIEGVDSYEGSVLMIEFQNENLIAKLENEDAILACVPDMISIIDSDTGEPVPTEDVRYGLRVACIVLPAPNLLRSERALRFVGPQGFGYPSSVKYMPIGDCPEERAVGPL